MGEAGLIDRAWMVFAIGLVFLALTALQLWTGKSKLRSGPVFSREERPKDFWFVVSMSTGVCLFCIGLGAVRLVAIPAGLVATAASLLAIGSVWLLARRLLAEVRRDVPKKKQPITFASVQHDDAEISISVRGWRKAELDQILADFLRSYELAGHMKVDVTTKSGDVLAVTLPDGIEPDMLYFLVNYIQYPKNFEMEGCSIGVLGRARLTRAFEPPNAALIGKNVSIYVPSEDDDFDLVYVQVDEGAVYQVRFTNMKWKRVDQARRPATIVGL